MLQPVVTFGPKISTTLAVAAQMGKSWHFREKRSFVVGMLNSEVKAPSGVPSSSANAGGDWKKSGFRHRHEGSQIGRELSLALCLLSRRDHFCSKTVDFVCFYF